MTSTRPAMNLQPPHATGPARNGARRYASPPPRIFERIFPGNPAVGRLLRATLHEFLPPPRSPTTS